MGKDKGKKEYDNVWTKLGLGSLRGNKVFKAVWRALRVGAIYACLELLRLLPGLNVVPQSAVLALSPMIEKALREFLPTIDF